MNLCSVYGEKCEGAPMHVVMPNSFSHRRCHDHLTRLKLDVMTSNERQNRSFSKTVI